MHLVCFIRDRFGVSYVECDIPERFVVSPNLLGTSVIVCLFCIVDIVIE
jgi:hypothetical protein